MRLINSFLITVLLTGGWAFNATDFYKEGLRAAQSGDFPQAATLLRRAVAHNPKNPDPHLQLGIVLTKLKRLAEAEVELQLFLRFRPDSLDGHQYLAGILAEQGKTEALARELKTLVRLGSASSKASIALANSYLTLAIHSLWDAYRSAPSSEKSGLETRISGLASAAPDTAESYFIQGHFARVRGDEKRAHDLYARAGQSDPAYLPPRLLADARRAVQDNELDEALDNLQAIAMLGAGNLESELLSADVLIRSKDYSGAVDHLERISSQGARDPRFARLMANAYLGSGQAIKAIPHLSTVLSRSNDNALRKQLAEAYKSSGDYTKAVAEYEKLLQTEPNPAWVRDEIMNLTREKLLAAKTVNAPVVLETAARPAPVALKLPSNLVLLPPNSRAAVVEKETQTLLVYRATPGGIELEKTFACSTGEKGGEKLSQGDKKTPEGVYLFLRVLPGNQLPEIYGKMAITLDYPNPFDRLEGKGGDGIWVHATNEPIRPYLPNKTRGCVVVSNEVIEELSKTVALKQTPLIIVPKIQYEANTSRESDAQDLKSFLSEWRNYWESKQLERYISLYSSKFRNGNQDLRAWKAYKNAVFSAAGKIELRIDLKSIVRYEKYSVLTFHQDYQSQRLTSKGMKRLFTIQENGKWKIIAEDWMD